MRKGGILFAEIATPFKVRLQMVPSRLFVLILRNVSLAKSESMKKKKKTTIYNQGERKRITYLVHVSHSKWVQFHNLQQRKLHYARKNQQRL